MSQSYDFRYLDTGPDKFYYTKVRASDVYHNWSGAAMVRLFVFLSKFILKVTAQCNVINSRAFQR